GRAGGILGIHRDGQYALASFRPELIERPRNRRVAVAHAQLHPGVQALPGQFALYGISLRLAPYQQRRPVLQPDVAIPWRQRPRPPWKNEEPENDLPDPRGDLYDARIGKEFRQVPAYVAR